MEEETKLRRTSTATIMTVKEMIETAFGDPERNVVNFKLMYSIFLVLANQLRLLQRQVALEIDSSSASSKTKLTVSEIKIVASNITTEQETKLAEQKTLRHKRSTHKSLKDKSPEKPTPNKTSIVPNRESIRYRPLTEKTSADDVQDFKIVEKHSTEKTRSHVPERYKSTEKPITEEAYDSSPKYKSEEDSSVRDSFHKQPGEQSKSKIPDQELLIGKSAKKSSRGKSPIRKRQGDSTKIYTTEPTDRDSQKKETKSTHEADIKKYSDKLPHEELSVIMSSASSTNKPTAELSRRSMSEPLKTSSLDVKAHGTDAYGSSLRKVASIDSDKHNSKKSYTSLLEKIEEQREQILRIINQRKDSYQESLSPPTPIASVKSSEMVMEKLLLVQRVPSDDIEERNIDRKRPLSIVTKDQFEDLVERVIKLQKRFEEAYALTSEAPENMELLRELRKGSASLSEAIGALQLSVRLEEVERNVDELMTQIGGLEKDKPLLEMKPSVMIKDNGKSGDNFGETASTLKSMTKIKSKADLEMEKSEMINKEHMLREKYAKKHEKGHDDWDDVLKEYIQQSSFTVLSDSESGQSVHKESSAKQLDSNFITKRDMQSALDIEKSDVLATLYRKINRSNTLAAEALRQAELIDMKFQMSVELTKKLLEIEKSVNKYTEKVNNMDTILSAQLANYQDQMTQMQFDLEAGLENMAEAIAGQGINPEVIIDLDKNMSNLQGEIEAANVTQKEAIIIQNTFALDLSSLKREIELLRDAKCDRDEVEDALRDKAGIRDLNGMVTLEVHMATVVNFENRIKQAYKTFECHELIWQKVIDQFYEDIEEKADVAYLNGLRDDINKHLNNLREQIDTMQQKIGEPLSAGVTRTIYHDTACLSCSSPAHITPLQATVPRLPSARQPGVGAEMPKTKEGEYTEHPVCIPGQKIPHPIDSRAEICTRYCGRGTRSTRVPFPRVRCPTEMYVESLNTACNVESTIGSDGKVYRGRRSVKFCIPCNMQPREAFTAEMSTSELAEPPQRTCECAENAPLPECGCRIENPDGIVFTDLDVKPSCSVMSVATGVLTSISSA